jgi:hypothetical protein
MLRIRCEKLSALLTAARTGAGEKHLGKQKRRQGGLDVYGDREIVSDIDQLRGTPELGGSSLEFGPLIFSARSGSAIFAIGILVLAGKGGEEPAALFVAILSSVVFEEPKFDGKSFAARNNEVYGSSSGPLRAAEIPT